MSTATTSKTRSVLPESEEHADLLRTAFSQICDPDDWKAPIDCIVPWASASLYVQAITFMTATNPACKHVIVKGYDCAHLTSIGYRMGPAGDH